MLYNIRMDGEEAKWIVNLFKAIQARHLMGGGIWVTDDDIERMESFISRIRVQTRK
jgi:hypothetical protein